MPVPPSLSVVVAERGTSAASRELAHKSTRAFCQGHLINATLRRDPTGTTETTVECGSQFSSLTKSMLFSQCLLLQLKPTIPVAAWKYSFTNTPRMVFGIFAIRCIVTAGACFHFLICNGQLWLLFISLLINSSYPQGEISLMPQLIALLALVSTLMAFPAMHLDDEWATFKRGMVGAVLGILVVGLGFSRL
jgi:hypothetical protein